MPPWPLQLLRVTLWEAVGSMSPGQASHLLGRDWESITEVGWNHEVGVQRRSMGVPGPVGALMHGLTAHTHL